MLAVELSPIQKELADNLWNSGAFKIGLFKTKFHQTHPNAPLSPYYISMREDDVKPRTFFNLSTSIVSAIYLQTEPLLSNIDHVIGIPNAGRPFAKVFHTCTYIHLLTMEKIETPEGRRISSIINEADEFKSGDKVLGVDDLVSEAGTKIEFKEGLEANGLVLAHLAVALDREQGGMDKLRDLGISVSAALRISQMLDYYLGEKYLDQSTYDRIRSYIEDQNKH